MAVADIIKLTSPKDVAKATDRMISEISNPGFVEWKCTGFSLPIIGKKQADE